MAISTTPTKSLTFWCEGFPFTVAKVGASNLKELVYWSEGFSFATADAGLVSGASGDVTFTRPDLDGSGTFTPPARTGSGGVAFRRPDLSGSGVIVDPLGPASITQEGRYNVTAEDTPLALLTQMARGVTTEEATPFVYLTQMARNVLYRITCGGPGGGGGGGGNPTDIPHVHFVDIPVWKLERFDTKVRIEEIGEGSNTNLPQDSTPTWKNDGTRWVINRMDFRFRPEEKA